MSSSNPIILISGSDADAVKRETARLVQDLTPTDPMNFEIVDGRADSSDDAVKSILNLREAILTLPFFGGGKVIWWKSVNFLEDSGVGRFASVKEALEKLQDDLPKIDGTSVKVLISAVGIHKGRAFSKALLKIAKAQFYDLPDLGRISEDQVIEQIEGRMRGMGLRPGPGAAERFFQATGVDTSAWRQELEKLALFAGEGTSELSRTDVDRIISGTRDILIWDFSHAVLEGEAKTALSLLASLLAKEESEVGILMMLAGQVRLATLGAVLCENKMLKLVKRGFSSSAEISPAAEVYLPKKKSGEPISTWALGQATQRSSRQPAQFWIQALNILYRAQKEMVTGQGDKARLLELAVLEIVAN